MPTSRRLPVVDRERVLAKLDELDGYLAELRSILPQTLEEYRTVATKRACERLLQIAVECVIDVCNLTVTGMRLGLPGEEDDLFEKLEQAGVLSATMSETAKRMKGCRNLLVHRYGGVDDEIIFQTLATKLGDFADFKREILEALERV
jgi:uncharacterized protein YutE (UPF0331/DUF86 family)